MTQTFPDYPGDETTPESDPVAVSDDENDENLADVPAATEGDIVSPSDDTEDDEDEFPLRKPQDPNETQDIRFVPDPEEVVESDDDTDNNTETDSDSAPDVDDSV